MKIHVVSPKPEPKDKIIAERIFSSPETAARIRAMMDYIMNARSVLAFTNTREFAEILSSRIRTLDKKFPIGIHHSSLSKDVRINTEKDFKGEKVKSVICTSSLQLGIDIGAIDLVLQYQSPRQVSQAIQRIGRSGHELERVSKGVIITTDEDDIFESAVIARKALNEELEPIRFHDNSYDVLAHQIVGLTMDGWNIELEKAYQIIKRAYPFRNLQYAEFLEVCKQLQQLGLVFLNGGIKKKTVGLQYYFGNLSTIPDTLQYHIFNTIDNSFVGVLDEEFIAIHGEVGSNFIIKGEAWRIVDITEDKVLVEPTVDIEAAIPGWEGELIPVPFDVAQEVGKLRRIIAVNIEKYGEETDDIMKELQQLYPIDNNSARKIIKTVKKQMECGTVPDDKTILVEDFENMVVLHTCFGSSVNETLGRFLSAMLTNRLGSVGFKCDPYRIMLQLQVKNVDMIKETLLQTNPELLRSYLEISLTKSNLFEWKFVHVAKRFGAIARGAQYGKVRMGKIIDSYVGSPIYKETLKDLEVEKLDIELATEMLRKIQGKKIALVFRSGELSQLGSMGVKRQYAEVIGPEKPNKEIFEMFKHRLQNTKVKMVCVNCGQWQQTFIVKELPKVLKCKKCEAKLLGVTRVKSIDMGKLVKKKIRGSPLTSEEAKRFERLRMTGDMFLVYGNKAVLCLAAKGVGPQTASRILAKYHKSEEELMRDILEAERIYIRTKKYWKL
jgi:ATP-dependent Lhr-like helicase